MTLTYEAYKKKQAEILKALQVQTIRNYDTARKNGSELAELLLPDAWSLRLDEAAQQLDAIAITMVGDKEPHPENEGHSARHRLWSRNALRAELRHIITGTPDETNP